MTGDIFKSFGMKELYSVVLKTTSSMKIGKKDFAPGEVVVRFDRLFIGTMDDLSSKYVARGGKGNIAYIMWDRLSEVRFQLTQGVFSKTHLAIAMNSNIYQKESGVNSLLPMSEYKETNASGLITLRQEPDQTSPIFLYKDDGTKIESYTISGKNLTIADSFTNVLIDYSFIYTDETDTIRIGERLLNGYLRLEGRMRVKEDITGAEQTAILTIPRLRIVSDISMRLGESVSPMTNTFYAVGYPSGDKGEENIGYITFLPEDIDI